MVLYPQWDHFVLLGLYFLTFHLPKKNLICMKWAKSIVLFRTAILAVYCFVSKGIWFACFRERVLFIGTRFSNLMKRPRRGQTLEEDEIKELKLKFKKITFSIMMMILLLFLLKQNFVRNPSSQILFYSSSKQDFTISYRNIGSILFCSQGYELFARFSLMKPPPRERKKNYMWTFFWVSYRVTGAGICVFFPRS